jgi:two-component system, NtrC family, response regulator HydG
MIAHNAHMTLLEDPTQQTRSLLNKVTADPDGARPSFLVVVLAGADRGLAFEIDGATATRSLIGSSHACAVRLRDPLASRRHAAIDVEADGLRIQDLGSKNGTIVNGLRVADVLLAGGEVIRIGATMLKVDRIERANTSKPSSAMSFGRVIGASAEMRRLYPRFHEIAQSAAPALIEGESGTGKELLAEALHEMGPRASGPFVVLDCSALADDALSAVSAAFEQAIGGTLLLDEASELDAHCQRLVSEAIEREENVRIVVATRNDLDAEAQAGRFREDLLEHLAPSRIELPPLKRRKGDVALLARHVWRTLGGGDHIPSDLVARLETYAWPGNVRELVNIVSRRYARGEEEPFELEGAVDDAMERILDSELPFSRARAAALAEFEKRYVSRVLARHGGHVGRAAAASGIARRYFQMIRGRSAR